MRTPAFLATVLFSTFLTACGGGGDPVAGTNQTPDEGEPIVTTEEVVRAELGSGTGGDFDSGVLLVSQSALSAGGSTQISATIVDAGANNLQIVSDEYTVVFASSCQADGRAEFSKSEATTSSGSVSVTYTAAGCSGEDVITFSLFNSDRATPIDIATGAVNIAPAEIGAIAYVGATAPLISIATIGDAVLPKLSTLTFQVLDKGNNPVSNRTVTFELTNESGGIQLSLDSSVTNENGEVRTAILSGSTHAVTSVRATTLATDNTTEIYTNSQQISVTTGIADQDSFSIAIDKFSTWGWANSGETSAVEVTAFANDHFQNPVPDGTIVNFLADSGSIGSSCETTDGTCSVTWISSSPLPGADESGQVYVQDGTRTYDAGRVQVDATWNGGLPGVATVLAYTAGEAGFSDANGNNLYDDGESFNSYAEAFLDANENGSYDYDPDTNPREGFIDFDNDGAITAAPSTYQGITCADNTTHCASLMHVRDSARFIVASSDTTVDLFQIEGTSSGDLTGASCVVMDGEDVLLSYLISDINGNVPPAGTTGTLDVGDLNIVGPTSFEVPVNAYGTEGYVVTFTVRPDPDEPTFTPESPILAISEVGGFDKPVINSLQLTSFTGISVGSSPALPAADAPIVLSFSDACGDAVGEDLSVVVRLSNGQFVAGDPAFQTFNVPAGTGTLTLDITSDGTPSYVDEGIELIIFREGFSSRSEVDLSLVD